MLTIILFMVRDCS